MENSLLGKRLRSDTKNVFGTKYFVFSFLIFLDLSTFYFLWNKKTYTYENKNKRRTWEKLNRNKFNKYILIYTCWLFEKITLK